MSLGRKEARSWRPVRPLGSEFMQQCKLQPLSLVRLCLRCTRSPALALAERVRITIVAVSTTTDKNVALSYAESGEPLVFKYETSSSIDRGVSIDFLSVYPGEKAAEANPRPMLLGRAC